MSEDRFFLVIGVILGIALPISVVNFILIVRDRIRAKKSSDHV